MTRESWDQHVFDRLYTADPDPWRFDTSPYEAAKYADTLSLLDDRHFPRILELGCANGAMTAHLASRCTELVALDISPAAIALATTRLRDRPHVAFHVARMPTDLSTTVTGGFDLVVMSEILYFLSPADIDLLAGAVLTLRAPAGLIVLANWTGPTDTPCNGEEAADRFVALAASCQPPMEIRTHRRDAYRLDVLA